MIAFFGNRAHNPEEIVPRFGGRHQLVQRVRSIFPTRWVLGIVLDDGAGNVQSRFPFVRSGIDSPPQSQNVGVNPQRRRDIVQFFVCGDVVAQFEPALGSLEMKAIGRLKPRSKKALGVSGMTPTYPGRMTESSRSVEAHA